MFLIYGEEVQPSDWGAFFNKQGKEGQSQQGQSGRTQAGQDWRKTELRTFDHREATASSGRRLSHKKVFWHCSKTIESLKTMLQ